MRTLAALVIATFVLVGGAGWWAARAQEVACDGVWVDVPYAASNFSGEGGIGPLPPWDVQPINQVAFGFTRVGDVVTLGWQLDDWRTGQARVSFLKLKVPNGWTIARTSIIPIRVRDNDRWQVGVAVAFASEQWVYLFADVSAGTTWRGGPSSVQGQIAFPVVP